MSGTMAENFEIGWAGLSIVIDMVLIYIPISILRRTRLKHYERRVLYMVFCASLVGTVMTYVSRISALLKLTYSQGRWSFRNLDEPRPGEERRCLG